MKLTHAEHNACWTGMPRGLNLKKKLILK